MGSGDIQFLILLATASLVAAIWLTPANLAHAAHQHLSGALVSAADLLAGLLDSLRVLQARLLRALGLIDRAMSRMERRSSAASPNRLHLVHATGRASTVAHAAPAIAATASLPRAVAATAARAVPAVVVATQLSDERQWQLLSSRVEDRLSRVENVTVLQRRAAEQLDAAIYGLDRLVVELAAVMPDAARGLARTSRAYAVPKPAAVTSLPLAA